MNLRINWYKRGLETCPQATLHQSGRAILSFFCDAPERRVWLSAESKILGSTIRLKIEMSRRYFAKLGSIQHVTSPMHYFATKATSFQPSKMRHSVKKRHFAKKSDTSPKKASLYQKNVISSKSQKSIVEFFFPAHQSLDNQGFQQYSYQTFLAKWRLLREVTFLDAFSGMKRIGPCVTLAKWRVEVTLVWRSYAYPIENYSRL